MLRLASRSSKKTWSGLASSGPWYTSNQLRGPGSHHSSTINARTMAEQLPQNSGWLSTKHINITTSTYHYHRFCSQKLLHVGQFYLKRTISIREYDTYYYSEILYCNHMFENLLSLNVLFYDSEPTEIDIGYSLLHKHHLLKIRKKIPRLSLY